LRNVFYILILLVIFLSCKKEKNISIEIGKNLPSNTEVKVSKQVDNDFNVFFKLFNQDSIFQMSRVDFPLKIKTLDGEYELINQIVKKEEYRITEFLIGNTQTNHEYDNFKQDIVLGEEEVIVSWVGIDNGIAVEFMFKKNNGKWMLITYVDHST